MACPLALANRPDAAASSDSGSSGPGTRDEDPAAYPFHFRGLKEGQHPQMTPIASERSCLGSPQLQEPPCNPTHHSSRINRDDRGFVWRDGLASFGAACRIPSGCPLVCSARTIG